MRLIDADAFTAKHPEIADVISEAQTVEDAIVLPFKIGTRLWCVDVTDGYKVTCFEEDETNRVYGIAYYGKNMFEIIKGDGSSLTPGEEFSCLSKEEAIALRKHLLEHITQSEIKEAIKDGKLNRPEEWKDFKHVCCTKEEFVDFVNKLQ